MSQSNLVPLSLPEMQAIAQKLESLNKSFAAGYQGLANAGRTGTSAIAIDNLETTMRSITLEDEDFLLTKDIQQVPAKQSVYNYVLKTAVRSGVDLFGIESFLPQEDHSQYIRVAEVLKVQGIRKTITHMAQLINDIGGYMVDLEAENDTNATLGMAESLERALYVGGDYYIDSTGAIDATLAANPNAPVRQIRGLQAQIREGNRSARGIPGDFIGYGNNRSTVFNLNGSVLERGQVDKIMVSVRDSRGRIEEAHCTTSQLQQFRATFFPFERGDLGAAYMIKGADVKVEPKEGFPLQTVTGVVQFIPSVFKYNRVFPEPVQGSIGAAPSTPAISSSSQVAGKSGFKAGDVVSYVVQAASIMGMSGASASAAVTILADGNKVSLVIAAQAGVEEFSVFRSEIGGAAGSEKFIGRVLADRAGGTTTFVDAQTLLPGLDSVLFLPKSKDRAKLAVLGNLVSKMKLGLRGLAEETVYVSYLACILEKPRFFALADNVFQLIDDSGR